MKKLRELSFQEETNRLAEEIKENIEQHPELAQMTVSEENDADFFKRARELEAELKAERLREEESENEEAVKETAVKLHEFHASAERTDKERTSGNVSGNFTAVMPSRPGSSVYVDEEGRKYILVVPKKKRKKRLIVALVAMLVLVLGLGITSIGSKSYLKSLFDKIYGGEDIKTLNVDDMDVMSSEDGEEATAYKEIGEKLGIYAVELEASPEGMHLIETQIEDVLQQADLFYQYKDEIIRYTIYLNDKDSSWGETAEDEEIREYMMTVKDVDITIKEYKIVDYEIYRRIAKFNYRGVHYRLSGIMEQEEFEKILKNLHFF